ncbi:MAG: hypothetical protein EOO77_22230 [Oxalobacteraceae bacterium]|nr:MAG: hypothetical protein EOO77_22230 [Oxalobacteraceae bacterium]
MAGQANYLRAASESAKLRLARQMAALGETANHHLRQHRVGSRMAAWGGERTLTLRPEQDIPPATRDGRSCSPSKGLEADSRHLWHGGTHVLSSILTYGP